MLIFLYIRSTLTVEYTVQTLDAFFSLITYMDLGGCWTRQHNCQKHSLEQRPTSTFVNANVGATLQPTNPAYCTFGKPNAFSN